MAGTSSKEIHDAARLLAETADLETKAGGSSSSVLEAARSSAAEEGASGNLTDHIEITPLEDINKISQTCRYCGKSRTSGMFQSTKWASHLLTCVSVSFAVRKAVLLSTRSREVQETALEVPGLDAIASNLLAARGIKKEDDAAAGGSVKKEHGSTSHSAPPQKRQKSLPMVTASSSAAAVASPTMLRFDPCDAQRADRINLAIASFLASCSLPMVTVESPTFLSLLRTLNKTYVDKFLASSDVFTTKWLPSLYSSVEDQVKKVGMAEKNVKPTLGLEAFPAGPGGSGSKLCVFTEAYGSRTIFQECMVEPDTDNVAIVMKQLETIADERGGKNVEDIFAAVTLVDANLANAAVTEAIAAKYPKLFVSGCRSQCAESIVTAIVNIDEINHVIQGATLMSEVITSHPALQTAFSRLSGGSAVMRPDGLRNLSSVLACLVAHSSSIQGLLHDESWESTAAFIAPTAEFEALVTDDAVFEKMKCLNRIIRPMCVFLAHVERLDFRPSWVVPLFEALIGDAKDWLIADETERLFEPRTLEVVLTTIEDWWKGFNSDHFLLATIFDPSTFPEKDSLPGDWLAVCTRVLKRFYTGPEMTDARQELMKVVACSGMYGEEVEQRREEKSRLAVPPDSSKVEVAVQQQVAAVAENPHLMWDTVFYRQFPRLGDIANRLMAMATRANVVEKSCTVGRLTKASDRLYNKKVYMLLYCYINLRLLHSCGQGQAMDEFLEQAVLDAANGDHDKKKAPGEL